MVATRFRSCARALLLGFAVLGAVPTAGAGGRPPLRDAPVVWYADDDAVVPVPVERDPAFVRTELTDLMSRSVARSFDPVRLTRGGLGYGRGGPAANVNALDEVPNSSWFTNRIGLRPLTRAELAAGPGGEGPDRSAPWTIIGAKVGGVTPGFRIRDARGDVWLLKFDPPDHPGQSIRAGVVSNLILHACGYSVPQDRLEVFPVEQLVPGEGASLRTTRGLDEIPLTAANLDSILQATNSIFDGEVHALASKFLAGDPLGPFDWQGTRPDDPNDRVPHQHRRELRGLRVIAAWINHVDVKQQNTLDTFRDGHTVHHLIDFATTLGASGAEAFAKFGYEYGMDAGAMGRRLFTAGLSQDVWQEVTWPEHLDEVGYFTAESFDPDRWRPILPNPAFVNCDRRDGYWAAKIVSAFTDRDLRVMVAEGRYRDPRAVDYLVEHLARRRDIIARTWFDRVPPLDFFTRDGDTLGFRDLGHDRGIYPGSTPRYRYRFRSVDSDRSGDDWTEWTVTHRPVVPLADATAAVPPVTRPFLAIACQVDRGGAWSRDVTVYLARVSGRTVALDR